MDVSAKGYMCVDAGSQLDSGRGLLVWAIEQSLDFVGAS
jgi:hypothetical protein